MKKALISRNSKDGAVACLFLQSHFDTCDPLFGEFEKVHLFKSLGVSFYSVGIKAKCDLYIDNEGEYVEKEHVVIKPDKTLARIAFELFPNDRYAFLTDLCEKNEDFSCFFELYGASSAFGQLRSDPDSWYDENVKEYKNLQERLSEEVIMQSSGDDAEVYILPKEMGPFGRKLVFIKTRSKLVFMIQNKKFWCFGRHGAAETLSARNFHILKRKDNEICGFFISKPNPLKIRNKLKEMLEDYNLRQGVMV